MPLSEPIVAAAGTVLVHKPPVIVLVSGVVEPAHTVDEPVMGRGDTLTVTVVVAEQPVGRA
jgi:hypothetical protein